MAKSLKLKTPYSDFRKNVLVHSLDQLNARAKNAVPQAQTKIQKIVRLALDQDSTIQSMKSGRLKMELGIPTSSIIDNLSSDLTSSITVKYQSMYVRGTKFSRPFVSLSSITANELLSNPDYEFISENGHSVKWLDWLLNRGDEQIISGYFYRPANRYELRQGFSRAGGIMRPSNSGRWGVPPEFSGSKTDNFLTRIRNRILPDIEKALTDILI